MTGLGAKLTVVGQPLSLLRQREEWEFETPDSTLSRREPIDPPHRDEEPHLGRRSLALVEGGLEKLEGRSEKEDATGDDRRRGLKKPSGEKLECGEEGGESEAVAKTAVPTAQV